MKIGIVCPYNLAMPGGVQQHVFEQAKELKARGHNTKIITPKPMGKLLIDDRDVLFLGTSARFKTPQHTSVDVSISVTTDAIDQMLSQEKFDVIHIHEPLVPILARQMLPRITCPVVGTFHAAIPETVLAKSIAGSISPYVKSVIKHLSAITAVSSSATSYIRDLISIDTIHLIPNGVDLPTFRTRHKYERSGILYIGRLEKRKGVRYLLEAFALFASSHPSEHLTIAGDGPEMQKLQKLAEELGIDQSVSFLGYITEQQKVALLQQCGLFVSPALYGESFGIVLVEAMASGAIALGGYNPGYRSVMTGLGSLCLVDPAQTELFADRIELLLYNPSLRQALLDWSKKEVKKYSYKDIVQAYEKIYFALDMSKQAVR